MDSEIYVNNNEIIETYFVKIDEKKLKKIQDDINKFYGKGEVRETVSDGFYFDIHGKDKKIEIISSEYVGKGEMFDSSYPETMNVSMYRYKYYSYVQYRLSKICDEILESYGKIGLSKAIKNLFDFIPSNYEDTIFVEEILDCIEMKRIDCEDLIKSDISEEKKEGIFKRVIRAIRNDKDKPFVIVYPEGYEFAVNREIKKLKDNSINKQIYDEKTKNEIKRDIFESLPTKNQIIKKR